MLGVAEAEFERHAAKHQRQQHHQDGKIDRRQDDGEGQRERPPASPRPPSTSQVSLPSQIGAMEFIIRLRSARVCGEIVENADAQIETVEHAHRRTPPAPRISVQTGTKSCS